MEFTDQNFEAEVLKNDKPVLVDFWAPWCGPCQIMGPIIEDVAKEMGAEAKIGKLNVDDNPMTAQTYGVMSIPTIIVFHKGALVKQVVGVQAKETLINELKNIK